MTRAKICGIRDPGARDAAVASGADAVGFVVEIPRSRRSIGREEAKSLIRGLPPFVSSVVVMEPKSAAEAASIALDTGADVLQVNGTLAAEDLSTLREMVAARLVATVPAVPGALEEVRRIAEVADALLVDSQEGGKLGGTGAVHDWNLSADLVEAVGAPVILAGGLSPENVAEAIRAVGPYAVDVSTGVETEGRKDPAKIAAFLREVRCCPPR
ncbi:MAG: phosphoribosylanthranilate isomerase [Methanothrix sp.]|jgi:phosphoribosylanthranilate isomerase|nr:phosphoribosylanthranilate isomerase [Methanothrix sp.]OPX78920.1 MAG: N-(5'-phosphoribosyl)anthranilate isomerase [Methanosaeta sp. PtaB.Bin087]NLX38077.1 phosphoribosylanthranilate isomerase [Methanothrix sp.]HNR57872.1 phosphoribosylanthranilate isomerase [Methanothrix sp.]HNT73353.1 phosphoribosylanthranilate isomerase [Methanothrix sp.]